MAIRARRRAIINYPEKREPAVVWSWWPVYTTLFCLIAVAFILGEVQHRFSAVAAAFVSSVLFCAGVMSALGFIEERRGVRDVVAPGLPARALLYIVGVVATVAPIIFAIGVCLGALGTHERVGFALAFLSLVSAPAVAVPLADDVYRRKRPVEDAYTVTLRLLRFGLVYSAWYWWRYVAPGLHRRG
jgi:hypothetical protein